jgi:uncharacterized protein with GYD domain
VALLSKAALEMRIKFYDFVSIVEAPDNEPAAHLSIDLGSRGSVSITTLPAISTAQLRDKLRGPKQMGRS